MFQTTGWQGFYTLWGCKVICTTSFMNIEYKGPAKERVYQYSNYIHVHADIDICIDRRLSLRKWGYTHTYMCRQLQ